MAPLEKRGANDALRCNLPVPHKLMQLGAVFALHLLLKRGGDQAGGREPLGFHERLLGRRFGTVLASGERARHDHDADYHEDAHHDQEEHGEHAVQIRVGQRGLGVGQRLAGQLAGVDLRLILGGGGEGGFANRTPEATMEGLTKFGVTTVVGCLGTDGIGRDMCALVAKTKGLNEQGMSAYCYTGSYQIPVHTLTDSIVKDIMMIQEIIGTGEIAISDHRSSQPTFEEFARVVADTRLGGVLSGKAGIVNVHLGDSPRCLDLIERVVDETEIPASQILPTHINRNEMLFGKSIEYALKGGAVDFTGNEDIDYWETICDEVRVCNGIKRMLDAGVNPDRMTISSDGQGSLPMYSSDGEFLGMGVGQSSCLLKEVKECVFKTEIPLEIAISTITSNPADILRLKGKGKVEEGYDADLCILDQELQLVEVIAKGNTVYTK